MAPTSPRAIFPEFREDMFARTSNKGFQSHTADSRRYAGAGSSSSIVFMPIASPPTPAPSPGPSSYMSADSLQLPQYQSTSYDPSHLSRTEFAGLSALGPVYRKRYLVSLLSDCSPSELLFISQTIAPMLRRDFLTELPPEIALHILSFIHEPKTLARASQVSKRWHDLVQDEWLWKVMCETHRFDIQTDAVDKIDDDDDEPNEESSKETERFPSHPMDPALQSLTARESMKRQEQSPLSSWRRTYRDKTGNAPLSHRKQFQYSYTLMSNMRRGGTRLRSHRMTITTPDGGVVTSAALDSDRVIVGCANSKVLVYSANTGVLCRTLLGHEQGVWAVHLVSRGGYWDEPDNHAETSSNELWGTSPDSPPTNGCVHSKYRRALGLDIPRKRRPGTAQHSESPGKPSDLCCTSEGWGQPNPIVVSAGCDKTLRVWDVVSGHCIYILQGHTATIRCVRVLHNRPIAVTGSRDTTVRVWDIQKGRLLRILEGHSHSVRCLDVCGNRVVSGSYDATCRIWNVDTGNCLHVLTGHEQEIYSVAFDGVRVVSGGMDTAVRVWDAKSGQCIALLQGHSALVCQLQLCPRTGLLATGGSDGRVITFDLHNYTSLQRIPAHDSSVTSLQFDSNFLITGGNDGRVRIYETQSGTHVRDLGERCESVWKVACKGGTCAVMCKRSGQMVIEIWTFLPRTSYL